MINSLKSLKKTTSKYKNKRVEYSGYKFDSIAEKDRFIELRMLENKGYIKDLKLQVPFVLISKSEYGRDVRYIADFTYYIDKELVVEDVKGVLTKEYKLKKRLMQEKYHITIQEVKHGKIAKSRSS